MTQELVDRPVDEAARWLVLKQLDKARAACDRLADPDDTEALHDFRVALRRMRSIERAYRAYLQATFPKKLRKGFKTLAQSTGVARDTEVQLEWLQGQWATVKAHERPGYMWLYHRLQQRKEQEYVELRDRVPKEFGKLEDKLRDRSSRAVQPAEEPFAQVAAGLVESAAQDLHEHLAHVHGSDDEDEVHAARIAGKRLRYLLEPIGKTLPEAKALTKELKALQDLMGEIHDNQVLSAELVDAAEEAGAERFRKLVELSLQHEAADEALEAAKRQDERAGLIALARDLHEARQDLLSRLAARIEAGDHDRLAEHVAQLTESLRARATTPIVPADAG